MSAPIHLRDCPCCRKPPHPESESGPALFCENVIDLATGEEVCAIGYSVRCIDCGAMVADEDREAVVRLWNGEPEQRIN